MHANSILSPRKTVPQILIFKNLHYTLKLEWLQIWPKSDENIVKVQCVSNIMTAIQTRNSLKVISTPHCMGVKGAFPRNERVHFTFWSEWV